MVALCHTNKACLSLENDDFKNRDVGLNFPAFLGFLRLNQGYANMSPNIKHSQRLTSPEVLGYDCHNTNWLMFCPWTRRGFLYMKPISESIGSRVLQNWKPQKGQFTMDSSYALWTLSYAVWRPWLWTWFKWPTLYKNNNIDPEELKL